MKNLSPILLTILLCATRSRAVEPGAEVWQLPTGTHNPSFGAFLGPDGTIYATLGLQSVISTPGTLEALAPDGSLKWSATAPRPFGNIPTIGADGTLYIGSVDGILRAYRSDGSTKWELPIPADGTGIGSIPAMGVDGTLYVTGGNGLSAVTSEGALKWFFSASPYLGNDIYKLGSAGIGSDGTIYFGSDPGFLSVSQFFAVNPDGTLKWATATTGRTSLAGRSLAIDDEGTIYFVQGNGDLCAFDPNGTLKWSRNLGGAAISSSPLIGPDETIYVAVTGKVVALLPDGTIKWQISIDEGIGSTPALDKNGNIYVGSSSNKLYCFGPGGATNWVANGPGGTPTITPSGTVLAFSLDYYTSILYALNGGSPAPAGPWPMLSHDAQRTGRAGGRAAFRFEEQPGSLAVNASSMVRLSATVSSQQPVNLQWKKNGLALPGATNSVLDLGSVSRYDAGMYQLWVSNDAGTGASASATLSVRDGPLDLSRSSPALPWSLTLNNNVHGIYEIEASTDLQSWTPVATVTNLVGTATTVVEPDRIGATLRFYRAVLQLSQ